MFLEVILQEWDDRLFFCAVFCFPNFMHKQALLSNSSSIKSLSSRFSYYPHSHLFVAADAELAVESITCAPSVSVS